MTIKTKSRRRKSVLVHDILPETASHILVVRPIKGAFLETLADKDTVLESATLTWGSEASFGPSSTCPNSGYTPSPPSLSSPPPFPLLLLSSLPSSPPLSTSPPFSLPFLSPFPPPSVFSPSLFPFSSLPPFLLPSSFLSFPPSVLSPSLFPFSSPRPPSSYCPPPFPLSLPPLPSSYSISFSSFFLWCILLLLGPLSSFPLSIPETWVTRCPWITWGSEASHGTNPTLTLVKRGSPQSVCRISCVTPNDYFSGERKEVARVWLGPCGQVTVGTPGTGVPHRDPGSCSRTCGDPLPGKARAWSHPAPPSGAVLSLGPSSKV